MSNNSERQQSLILHTVTPEATPEGYTDGGYRPVVGLEVANRRLWFPGKHGVTHGEEYVVPPGLAKRIADYAQEYYIDEDTRDAYRNCHIGAAAITGAGFMKWYDALDLANRVVYQGNNVSDLSVGQWGAIGERELGAYHSMVGIKPGYALQTDSVNGPLSVVAHDANMAYYRANYGDDADLFAPTGENPKY